MVKTAITALITLTIFATPAMQRHALSLPKPTQNIDKEDNPTFLHIPVLHSFEKECNERDIRLDLMKGTLYLKRIQHKHVEELQQKDVQENAKTTTGHFNQKQLPRLIVSIMSTCPEHCEDRCESCCAVLSRLFH